MSTRVRYVAVGLLIVAAIALSFRVSGTSPRQLNQSDFYRAVAEGRVAEVVITADGVAYELAGELKTEDGESGGGATRSFTAYIQEDGDLQRTLRESGVLVTSRRSQRGFLLSTLAIWIPMLLLLGAFVFFMRTMGKGGNETLSMMKSRARLASPMRKTTFADVAGVEEAKQDLSEIIEFLKDPKRFQKLGGKIPRGVLLVGPTGTGKTLLARAVAGEANVPFFSVSGSDFVEMFVGIGASRVRELFERGKKNAPCIVFIDEIDSVGRRRGAGLGGGHDEREQTLNQLLVQMDGFEANEGVIVLAATNRPDVLDPALLRPGRFDRQVMVELPDVRGREEILRIHTRKVPLARDVRLSLLARGTPGFSGADLANLVNEAALHGAGLGRPAVTQDDLELARDKVLMGAERRSLVVNDEDRRASAFHEAGHALVAHLLPEADPLHKVTIIPRGRSLGRTQQLPVEDRHTSSLRDLLAAICVRLGGRIAEELQLNRLGSGAADDFEKTSELARRMVTEWGMSKLLGPVSYGKPRGQIFLGREIAQHRDHSEATAAEIDREAKRIVMDCYQKVRELLSGRGDALTRIAEALLECEVLDASQVAALAEGRGSMTAACKGTRRAAAREKQEGAESVTGHVKGLRLVPEPGR